MTPDDVFTPEFERDPFRYYQLMRDRHPLYYHDRLKSYIISRFEDVERVVKDAAASNRCYAPLAEPVHGRTMLQMDGDEHAAYRGLAAPALRGRELEEDLRPVLEETARTLLGRLRGRQAIDFVQEFSAPYAIHAFKGMCALPEDDRADIQRWFESLSMFISNVKQDPVVYASGLQTRREISAFVLPLIARRREHPGRDLLSKFCLAEHNGKHLTDDEIRGVFSLLVVGGTGTVSLALALTLKLLLHHPEQLALVRQDRELLDRAFAEAIRHTSLLQAASRVLDADLELTGGTLPAGSTALCLFAAANRDERRFRAPDSFDLLREDLDVDRPVRGGLNHLGFGAGRHFCVGAMLAKMEVRVALTQVLDHAPDIQLDTQLPANDPLMGPLLRNLRTLRVRFADASQTPNT